MEKIIHLADLNIGEIGEVVELHEQHSHALLNNFGINPGMSIIVLQKTVDWLVQVGYNQVSLGKDYLKSIKVKYASI